MAGMIRVTRYTPIGIRTCLRNTLVKGKHRLTVLEMLNVATRKTLILELTWKTAPHQLQTQSYRRRKGSRSLK